MSGPRLTVLNVAYPLAPVGPDAVGGAEQILTRIDEALVAAGHRSFVIAAHDSSVRGQLVPIPPISGPLDAAAQRTANEATRQAIRDTIARYPVDLVHFHGIRFDLQLPPPATPVLITLHLPAHMYPAAAFQIEHPNTFVHGVSASQQATLPKTRLRVLPPIPNGVPLPAWQTPRSPGTYTLALGRICPEKGFDFAARASRAAGVPLLLGGKVFGYRTHEEYFREVLWPLLDGRRIRFLGPLRKKQKQILLRHARCLLVPSRVPETSSLVAMEAAAHGTPVVAFRAGALPEVVEHERTGFLVDSIEQMADAIQHVDQIDRRECRAVAQRRFSADAMAERYLRRYAQIVARPSPIRHPAASPDDADPTIREVTSVAGMQAMRDEWAALWRRCGDSIFQHPDWLIPWCRPFNVREPWVLRLQHADRLVGVASFVVYERGGERVLTLLGAGISDDQDVLLETHDREAALGAVFRYLAANRSRWDVLELENLPEASPLLEFRPVGWSTVDVAQTEVRPVLTLRPGVRGLDEVDARSQVKEYRYQMRRSEREHLPISVEDADASNFESLFDALVELHRMRWGARGESGMLTEGLEEFHRDAARRLLEDGLLRLCVMSFAGRPGAAFYGYNAAGRTIFYLGGFDAKLSRFSPGKLVLAHAIDYAITRDGARAFDFLRGAEPYKYAWGAVDQPLYRRVLSLSDELSEGARADHAA